MIKAIEQGAAPADAIIDLGAASTETKGSNNHGFDGIEGEKLPAVGLDKD